MALGKVEAPDMVGSFRSEPDARAVVEPQPGAWLVFLGNLQPLATPDALHPILAHMPARDLEQGGDPPVAVAAILGSKGHDGSGKRVLVSSDSGNVPLRPSRLADDPAGLALREAVLLPDTSDRLPAPIRAYKF